MAQPTNTVEGVAQPDQEKKRLLPNAVFAIIQVLISSVVLFLLYRFLVKQLGIEALGVWTLVMAATSLANISNLGISGGIVRFVSHYLAKGDSKSAASAVETGVISLAILVSVAGISLWLAIDWGLGWIIPAAWLPEAKALSPFSILALWFSVIGGVVHSALEGCHRSDLRSISTTVCQPLLLIGAVMLSPTLGLKGVALAQIGQYVVWIVIGWVLLKRQIAPLPLLPFRWSKKLFSEMWRYGVNFQIVSILLILSEPLAKGLLSYYTNLSSVAYFEMANRLIVQAKGLLTSANQVITPYYAKLQATDSAKISHIYLRNLQLVALLGSVLFGTILASGPLLSLIWIGHLEIQFLVFLGILSMGWFANALAIPAYFANLGIAHLGPNVRGHLVIMLGMVVVSVSLGPWFKPYGSALAWPAGLLLGSFVINQGFLRHIQLPQGHCIRNLMIRRVVLNFAAGLAASLASLYFLQANEPGAKLKAFVCLASALTMIAMLSTRKVLELIRFNTAPPVQTTVP
jgi:O-antigen/teichoic acid export membrane protein